MKMAWALRLKNQVPVKRVVKSGDIDGFKSELVATWARMRRFPERRKQDVFLQGTDSQKKIRKKTQHHPQTIAIKFLCRIPVHSASGPAKAMVTAFRAFVRGRHGNATSCGSISIISCLPSFQRSPSFRPFSGLFAVLFALKPLLPRLRGVVSSFSPIWARNWAGSLQRCF